MPKRKSKEQIENDKITAKINATFAYAEAEEARMAKKLRAMFCGMKG